MRLIIAEKPSLARAIAEALPGDKQRKKTYIRAGDEVVAWCAGHILELAPPEAYSPELERWRLGDLPVVPHTWKLLPKATELLCTIRGLLEHASRVVHAGDPDREGQLLVDEVLEHLGYRGPVDRLLVSDLNPEAIRRQLARLEPNAKYRPLCESARGRQRADWLFGINLSRLYTLLGRAGGYQGVLSVGRVQTPVLRLIVDRDRAIATFRPVPYFVVRATLRTAQGESLAATWVPGPNDAQHLDPDKRLLSERVAQETAARLRGARGSVVRSTEEKRTDAPPPPYSLADLQIDAGKRLGLSAQEVLDTCQSLYETHRLLTYPRSDCSHLPEGHFDERAQVLDAIRAQSPALAGAVRGADPSRRSKAWNDKKVTAHHAIIPTPRGAGASAPALSPRERAVYELVARRYLAQFYGTHEYLHARVELALSGEAFVATGRQVLELGWRVLLADAPAEDQAAQEAERDRAPLPRLATGDAVEATGLAVLSKRTEPPKVFTDSSLISAMCNVARFVARPEVKRILADTDGIGTPATRAAIIETLFTRRYVTRAGKSIVSTETGRALIAALPEIATTPDLTAVWEAALRAIAEGREPLAGFQSRVEAQLRTLVAQGQALGRITVPVSPASPAPPARRTHGNRRSRSRSKAPRISTAREPRP